MAMAMWDAFIVANGHMYVFIAHRKAKSSPGSPDTIRPKLDEPLVMGTKQKGDSEEIPTEVALRST